MNGAGPASPAPILPPDNGTRTQFRNETDFTFEAQGRTNYSKAENPVPDADGVLVFDLNRIGWNPVSYCALGNMNNQIVQGHYPGLAPNEWDYSFTADGPSYLYVNAPVDSDIWFATQNDYIVSCWDCERGTIVLDCSYAGRGIELLRCKDMDVVMTTFAVGRGITIRECENVRVHDGNFENSGATSIHISRGNDNLLVENNRVYRPGESTSIAGIYVSGPQVPGTVHTIRNNRVIDASYGRFWEFDGAGIFFDEGGDCTHATDNTVIDCYIALKENSGLPGNEFERNTLIDNTHAISITDSAGNGASTLVYRDNFLFNTPEGGPGATYDPSPNYQVNTP